MRSAFTMIICSIGSHGEDPGQSAMSKKKITSFFWIKLLPWKVHCIIDFWVAVTAEHYQLKIDFKMGILKKYILIIEY